MSEANLQSSKPIKQKKKFNWDNLPYFTSAALGTLALFLFFGLVLIRRGKIVREPEVFLGEPENTNAVYRCYNDAEKDHMISQPGAENDECPGGTGEYERAPNPLGYVYDWRYSQPENTIAIYSCYNDVDKNHLVTRSQPGAENDECPGGTGEYERAPNPLGYIYDWKQTSQPERTIAVYRCYNDADKNHLVTRSQPGAENDECPGGAGEYERAPNPLGYIYDWKEFCIPEGDIGRY